MTTKITSSEYRAQCREDVNARTVRAAHGEHIKSAICSVEWERSTSRPEGASTRRAAIANPILTGMAHRMRAHYTAQPGHPRAKSAWRRWGIWG